MSYETDGYCPDCGNRLDDCNCPDCSQLEETLSDPEITPELCFD